MAKRKVAILHTNPGSVEPLIRLWLLRVLVPLGGYRQFLYHHGFNNDTLAEVLGLGHWIDSETREFDQKAVQSELRQLHQKAERQWYGERQSTFLSHNIAHSSHCKKETQSRYSRAFTNSFWFVMNLH